LRTQAFVPKVIEECAEKGVKAAILVSDGFAERDEEGAKLGKSGPDVTEEEHASGANREGKLLVNDRIADSVFQQVLTRTAEYDVFATPNLNGDYLSDACAAQVGGLGMAPGANVGDEIAFFEATHGTAPKYAGMNKVNPTALILSGALMLRHLGERDSADRLEGTIAEVIAEAKHVTYDLKLDPATAVGTSQVADAVVRKLEG
jgi:isocitrate dehydrogenase